MSELLTAVIAGVCMGVIATAPVSIFLAMKL